MIKSLLIFFALVTTLCAKAAVPDRNEYPATADHR